MDLESLSKVAAVCSSITAIGSLIAAFLSYSSSRKISAAQRELAQRQVILPLWGYISQLNSIDPKKPVTPDIITNINALELVALCCEAEIVDEKVISRTFSEQFISHFESISSCPDIGDGRSGRTIIKENRAAELFYDRLERNRKNSGNLKK